MTIFRWIIGVISALLVGGAVISFVLFMAFDIPVWLERARVFRRWMVSTLLFWFNTEIWGRVVWTLIHW
jgi:hypothetical protein